MKLWLESKRREEIEEGKKWGRGGFWCFRTPFHFFIVFVRQLQSCPFFYFSFPSRFLSSAALHLWLQILSEGMRDPEVKHDILKKIKKRCYLKNIRYPYIF